MNIHDVAAIIALGCAIYLIAVGVSDLIAAKVGKIVSDRIEKREHAPRNRA